MVSYSSPKQYDIYFVDLDPTIGAEIQKVRPCLVVSPNEMNRNIRTVIIAPLTTKQHPYPSRVKVNLRGQEGWIVLDQIRAIDKSRVESYAGSLDFETILKVKSVLKEILVD